MHTPLISIVIANYNYGRFLEEAIESVIAQNMGEKVELIVCDAASTDNSVDIIKKYARDLPPNTYYDDWSKTKLHHKSSDRSLITWWCSERDGGQAAAFNKGFLHSRGEWITWLNSDDILLPMTLMYFERLVLRKPRATWVTGNMLSFDSDTGEVLQVNWGPHLQPPLLRGRRAFNAVFGPTSFFKKTLYEKVGPIDERLRYAMDTEYWCRISLTGEIPLRLCHLCWAFRIHKESKTEGEQSEAVRSRREGETRYWHEKLGYYPVASLRNPWYIIWMIWRILDGSWFVRALLKMKYEGKPLLTYKMK